MLSPSWMRQSEKPLNTESHWPALTSTVCNTETAGEEEEDEEWWETMETFTSKQTVGAYSTKVLDLLHLVLNLKYLFCPSLNLFSAFTVKLHIFTDLIWFTVSLRLRLLMMVDKNTWKTFLFSLYVVLNTLGQLCVPETKNIHIETVLLSKERVQMLTVSLPASFCSRLSRNQITYKTRSHQQTERAEHPFRRTRWS